MKSLVRWSATVGLVGSALVGSLLAGATQVFALTQDKLLQKLRPVPVFTITNNQGAPLVASPKDQKGRGVAGVFITQKDAQTFLDGLKTRNPELAKGVKVVPVSLAEIYQMEVASKGKPDDIDFTFVPSKQQVDSAVTLLKQTGQKDPFSGTPLFVARSAGGKEGYLTIQQGNQSVIPVFFKKEELQTLIDRFKQQQPQQASQVEIQVLNLEGMIELLRTQENQALEQIVLIPPSESIEYVRSLLGSQKPAPGKPAAAPAKPQAAPAPKK